MRTRNAVELARESGAHGRVVTLLEVLQHRDVMAGNSKTDVDESDRVGKHASHIRTEGLLDDSGDQISSALAITPRLLSVML